MTPCVLMLLKWRATPDMLLSPSLTKKDLQFSTRTAPFSNYIIDSVLQHLEEDRAKDVSAPPRI